MNWDTPAWGSMSYYASDSDAVSGSSGIDASQACCDCMDPSSDLYTNICTGDTTGSDALLFTDSIGMTCENYAALRWCVNGNETSTWDPVWGSFTDLAIVDPNNDMCILSGYSPSSLRFRSSCTCSASFFWSASTWVLRVA